MNIVVFPYHKDIATTSAEFENLKSLEKTTAFLMPDHHQKFRDWVTALVYLVNTYHNTLSSHGFEEFSSDCHRLC
ncbi:MAG: hypothetical protein HXS52_12355 [Theionarchaea archaeon]|nr:hypothetical protein [Theionarchaea archaeon]